MMIFILLQIIIMVIFLSPFIYADFIEGFESLDGLITAYVVATLFILFTVIRTIIHFN